MTNRNTKSARHANTGARRANANRIARRNLLLESLESRRLLAVFQVTTASDVVDAGDGLLSLREAVDAANMAVGHDEIEFASSLDGVPIQISTADGTFFDGFGEEMELRSNAQGSFDVMDDLTIRGNGINQTYLDGNALAEILHIRSDTPLFQSNDVPLTVNIYDLTLQNGQAQETGGAIRANSGDLSLQRVRVEGNRIETEAEFFTDASDTFTSVPTARGGGIFKQGTGSLTIVDSIVRANHLVGDDGVNGFESTIGQRTFPSSGGSGAGAGIYANGSNVQLTRTRVQSNTISSGDGGNQLEGPNNNGLAGGAARGAGVYVIGGDLSIELSSVTQNTAQAGDGAVGRSTNQFSQLFDHPVGDAGDGGDGGLAVGAGVFFSASSNSYQFNVSASTISRNAVVGGRGGDGGFAGFHPPNPGDNTEVPASNHAFDGGNGGNAGNAVGGGIYLTSTASTPMDAVIDSATIAANFNSVRSYGALGLGGIDGQDGETGASGSDSSAGVHAGDIGVDATNTLIGDNFAGANPDFSGTFSSAQFVLLENTDGASGILPTQGNLLGIDPGLEPLTVRGSLTLYHPTKLDSVAVDASLIGSATDQRGIARPVGGRFDIGAYERTTGSTTFVVNSTGDDGDTNLADGIPMNASGLVTLRAAVEQANALSDTNGAPIRIHFDIPGAGPHQIDVGSQIPGLKNVIVDATTEPGYAGVPIVQIDGGGSTPIGLRNGKQIAGLSVTGFSKFGIDVLEDGSLITQNYIGLSPNGQPAPNGMGIRVLVNGSTPDLSPTSIYANVISGNSNHGIRDQANSPVNISHNIIGTSADGQSALANGGDGISVNNGTFATKRKQIHDNLVSGNARWGVFLVGEGSSAVVTDNQIGTNVDGTAAIPNRHGLFLSGGRTAAQDNLISGNLGFGVVVRSSHNVMQGNIIGLDAAGQATLANLATGIQVVGQSNIVGGPGAGDGNLISYNGSHGIHLLNDSDENVIEGNTIGTDISGQIGRGNAGDGIRIATGSSENTIRNNQIAGNSLRAIATDERDSSNNDILFNRLGTNADATASLHNGNGGAVRLLSPGSIVQGNVISAPDVGILTFREAADTVIRENWIGTDSLATADLATPYGVRFIGADTSGEVESNVFANNTTGVSLESGATGVSIRKNQFITLSSIAIDLGGDGATANDFLDQDAGENNLQNSPELIEALSVGKRIQFTYRIDSLRVESAYALTVDFYLVDGDGSIRTLLGTDLYLGSEVRSNKAINFRPVNVNVGDKVTAVATDLEGNTSEFSPELEITA